MAASKRGTSRKAAKARGKTKIPAHKPSARRKTRPVARRRSPTESRPAAAPDGSDWSSLTAADIMQSNVVTVAASSPLSEVGRILSDYRITGVPVTDEAGHIVGVISVRDLIERYSEKDDARPVRDDFFRVSSNELDDEDLGSFELPTGSEEETAGELMTADVFTVPAGAGLRQVAREMVRHRIHRLLVQDKGRTVGLVSTSDVLTALAR